MRKGLLKTFFIVMLLSNIFLGFQVIYSSQATPVKDKGLWNLILNLNRTRSFIYLLNQNIYYYMENMAEKTLLQNISIMLEIAYNYTFNGDLYLNLTMEQYNLGNYSAAKEYAITALHFYHSAIKSYMRIKSLLNMSLEIIICEEKVLKNRWVKYYNVTVYTGHVNKSPGLYTEYLRMRYRLDQYSIILENIVSKNESIVSDPLYIKITQLLNSATELYEIGFNALKNNNTEYAVNISTTLHKLLAEININIRKLSLNLTLYYIEDYIKKKFNATGMPEWVKNMTKNIRRRIRNGEINKAFKELKELMKGSCDHTHENKHRQGKHGNRKGQENCPNEERGRKNRQGSNKQPDQGRQHDQYGNQNYDSHDQGNQNGNWNKDSNNHNNKHKNSNHGNKS